MSSDKYIHSDVENRIYSYWEKNGLFKPKENSKKFSIVIPPPNVTGSLHMGHALNNSIQDLLVRYHRMNNFETLWQPGTDHAGIATQALVEKKLSSEKVDKNEISEEKILDIAIEAGADECKSNTELHEIQCSVVNIYNIKKELEKKISNFISTGIEWIPLNNVQIPKKDHETLINFFVSLEEDDDVQNVYSNAEFLN